MGFGLSILNRVVSSLSIVTLCTIPSAVAWGQTSWPFLGLWIVFGVLRDSYHDRKLSNDCFFLSISHIVLICLRRDLDWKSLKELSLWWEPVTGLSSTFTFVYATLLAGLTYVVFSSIASRSSKDILNHAEPKEHGDYPKELIFPCKTTHARIFPKKHSFSYSYLLYGIPIISPESKSKGGATGSAKDATLGKWWMGVRAEDYLERGFGNLGFYGKLRMTMREHGVQDGEWSYAYLVTAPRIFGYSFNPVSFWYIYDESHQLNRMILEVNNTFGERRVYLLDGSSSGDISGASVTDPSLNGAGKTNVTKPFRDAWLKDFHVSPFNSRKGSYALKAMDPFPLPSTTDVQIDNTITLKSSKDHGKIVARIYSTNPALDADSLGLVGTTRFIAGWWWVGLVTFPRILREATKLYFARGLHVWFRPEVLPSSIGRLPDSTEIALQSVFSAYLRDLIASSPDRWEITYHTAIPQQPTETIESNTSRDQGLTPKRLEIKVLNPVFYTRFVHYAHTSEAFDRESLFTDEKNRTVWISNPTLLPSLLQSRNRRPSPSQSSNGSHPGRSGLEELRWSVLKKLRCRPAEPAYLVTPRVAPNVNVDDIRTLPYSDMDRFMREGQLGSQMTAGEYRRIVMKVFLAQRFTLGFVGAVELVDLLVRVSLIISGVVLVNRWDFEVRREIGRVDVEIPWARAFLDGGWRVLSLALVVCGCHFYGLVKGYT